MLFRGPLKPRLVLGTLLFVSFFLVGAAGCLFFSWMRIEQTDAAERTHSLRMAASLAIMERGVQNGIPFAKALATRAKQEWPGVSQCKVLTTPAEIQGLPLEDRGLAQDVFLRWRPASVFAPDHHSIFIPLPSDKAGRGIFFFERRLPAQDIFLVRLIAEAGWPLALVVLLAAVSSYILLGRLARQTLTNALLRSLSSVTRLGRVTLIELGLAGIGAAIFVSGFYGIRADIASETERSRIEARGNELRSLRTGLDRIALQPAHRRDSVAALCAEFGASALFQSQPAASGERPKELYMLLQSVDGELDSLSARQTEIHRLSADRLGNVSLVFALVFALSCGSMILLRSTLRQQEAVVQARTTSEKHLAAYEQLSDNLPIGLFVYQARRMTYTNRAWDTLSARSPGQSAEEAWMNAMYATDRHECSASLAEAEKHGRQFELNFRMVGESGAIRYIRSCGLPIFDEAGRTSHLLGFTLDDTAQILAQRQLETKTDELEAKNILLRHAVTQLEDNVEAMVHALVRAVEAKDPYTAGHSERVMGYSVRLGERMRLTGTELRTLETGTLIHDIGKIGVPDLILTKPAMLTPEEYAVVMEHPTIGARMLAGVPMFEECVPIVLHHHERLNGSGYPDRLTGRQIPILVRIASVADAFDAMTSNRAYRKGMDIPAALLQLQSGALNGEFDYEVVRIFTDMVEREGIFLYSEGASYGREAA